MNFTKSFFISLASIVFVGCLSYPKPRNTPSDFFWNEIERHPIGVEVVRVEGKFAWFRTTTQLCYEGRVILPEGVILWGEESKYKSGQHVITYIRSGWFWWTPAKGSVENNVAFMSFLVIPKRFLKDIEFCETPLPQESKTTIPHRGK